MKVLVVNPGATSTKIAVFEVIEGFFVTKDTPFQNDVIISRTNIML